MAKKETKVAKAPKKEKVEKEAPVEAPVEELNEEKKVKYFVRDDHDRNFSLNAHGFDLKLVAGEAKEISKEVAEKIKEDFSYLTVSEIEE